MTIFDSFTGIDSDGNTLELRRCGPFPDLYSSSDGNIYRIQKEKVVDNNGSPAIRYRNSTVSARVLVADAWLPDWDNDTGTQLGSADGNRMNICVENLRPMTGLRGRPAGGELRKLAKIYSAFLLLPDVEALADALDISEREVKAAVALFKGTE